MINNEATSESKTHGNNNRVISFLSKVCQSSARVNYGSLAIWCCKDSGTDRQYLTIDGDALQIQVIMGPEANNN